MPHVHHMPQFWEHSLPDKIDASRSFLYRRRLLKMKLETKAAEQSPPLYLWMTFDTHISMLSSEVLGFFFGLIVTAVARIVLTVIFAAAAVILEELSLKIGPAVLLSQSFWFWRVLHNIFKDESSRIHILSWSHWYVNTAFNAFLKGHSIKKVP